MNHRRCRTIDRGAKRVDAAGQIYIFGIHEEPLVEEPRLTQSIAGREHKAALQIGHVERRRMIPAGKQIALTPYSPQE